MARLTELYADAPSSTKAEVRLYTEPQQALTGTLPDNRETHKQVDTRQQLGTPFQTSDTIQGFTENDMFMQLATLLRNILTCLHNRPHLYVISYIDTEKCSHGYAISLILRTKPFQKTVHYTLIS